MRMALTVVCILLGCSISLCSAEPRRIGLGYCDPLVYADLVVRGTVEGVSFERVRLADYFGPHEHSNQPLMIAEMIVRVSEVLKGSYPRDTVSIAGSAAGCLHVGTEYVLCLTFNKRLKGGMFVFGDGSASFALSEGVWTRVGDQTRLTYDEIKSITESANIESVARSAHLIAVGTVIGTRDYDHRGPDGHGDIRECTVEVDSLLKGTLEGPSLTFQMVTAGTYAPGWRTKVPPEINVGETWYLFLKKEEIEGGIGFYPFAGSNGMLKIEGERLIYDLRIDFPYTRNEVDEIVRRESSK